MKPALLLSLAVLLAVLGCLAITGCGSERLPFHDRRGLSQAEYSALPHEGAAPLIVASAETGELKVVNIPVTEIATFERNVLSRDPSATVALDHSVGVFTRREDSFVPHERLLFSGKQEFGLSEWEQTYPDSDGRGVSIAIVDDGIALGRPGLEHTSTGEPKIKRSIPVSPVWQLTLNPCVLEEDNAARAIVAHWTYQGFQLPDALSIRMRHPFEVTSCGINSRLTTRPRECLDLTRLIANSDSRTKDGITRIAAEFIEYEPLSPDEPHSLILIDINGDNVITEDERLIPLSQKGAKTIAFSDGRTLAFDVHNTATIALPPVGLDHPVRLCTAPAPSPTQTITMIPPHSALDFGSHGEGVASIAAGFRIGGRAFDGVAPGAQLVDVHFGDGIGGTRYTISEIARALKTGSMHADIVNLSYSLFFSSAAAQVAMGRLLEQFLAVVPGSERQPVFLFSAGNNGPGRGSMNRALLYPSFGISVAAYLDPQMSRSVFGSALPIGGVVTYSSRGPGIDGASGALLLSPLAGIAASTADQGFRPFSGTSSATPALAGFVARLMSQLKKEGLRIDRRLLRQALIETAAPLADTPFVDQGYGIPKLVPALSRYRDLLAASQTGSRPEISVVGARNSLGIPMRGVYIRGERDRADQFGFNLEPRFPSRTPESARATFAEALRISTSASWISVPPAVLLSRAPARILVAINWEELERLGPGEHISAIEVRNADDSSLRAVIPVTVIAPEPLRFTLDKTITVPAGGLERVFVDRPLGATGLRISLVADNSSQPLCGLAKAYSPNGVRSAQIGFDTDTPVLRREFAIDADQEGVYELDFEGRSNHQACPRDQRVQVHVSWYSLKVDPVATARDAQDRLWLELNVSTDVAIMTGKLSLSDPALERTVLLTATRSGTYEWKTPTPLDLSGLESFAFALDRAWVTARSTLFAYPYWDLRVAGTDPSKAPLRLDLPAGGEWTREFVIQGAREFDVVELTATAFDLGLDFDGGSAVAQLPIRVRTRIANTALRVEGLGFQTRRGSPVVLRAQLSALPVLPAPLSLQCRFTPDGSTLAIPCGSVTLR